MSYTAINGQNQAKPLRHNLSVGIARTEREIHAAQKLRYQVFAGEIDRQFADCAAVVIALHDGNPVIASGNGVVAVAGDYGMDSRHLGERIEFVQFRHAGGFAGLSGVGHGR